MASDVYPSHSVSIVSAALDVTCNDGLSTSDSNQYKIATNQCGNIVIRRRVLSRREITELLRLSARTISYLSIPIKGVPINDDIRSVDVLRRYDHVTQTDVSATNTR